MGDSPSVRAEDTHAAPDRLLYRAKRWLAKELRDMGLTLAVFIPCWLAFTTIFYELRSIPSESMVPGLQVGDRVAVSKFAYGYSPWSLPFGLGTLFDGARAEAGSGRLFGKLPERGDIAVFRHPRDDKVMIKRVIGLPGDQVQVRKGHLHLNGDPVLLTDNHEMVYWPYRGGFGRHANEYREILPSGSSYRILELSDNHPYDNTQLFTVPDGYLFMLGDSRDNSEDSRALSGHPQLAGAVGALPDAHGQGIGFVPFNHLIGRAETVLFTFHRCGRNPQRECPPGRVWRSLRASTSRDPPGN